MDKPTFHIQIGRHVGKGRASQLKILKWMDTTLTPVEIVRAIACHDELIRTAKRVLILLRDIHAVEMSRTKEWDMLPFAEAENLERAIAKWEEK